MPEPKESAIIKPPHVFDFDLLLKIIPSVKVGERVMRLDTIEHVEYQEIAITPEANNDDPSPSEDSITDIQLAVSHTSGCVYFFDDDEERELEEAIKVAIKKGEDLQAEQKRQQQEMMTLAAQEAYRRELQSVTVPGNVKTSWPQGFKKR
jgi:hypothetical protein